MFNITHHLILAPSYIEEDGDGSFLIPPGAPASVVGKVVFSVNRSGYRTGC